MKSTVCKIFVFIFFCTIVLAPAASATNFTKSSNTLTQLNPTIQLKVETFHLTQQDSCVRPYFIIPNGHTVNWDVSGYTFSELDDKVYGEYYHDSGVILFTNVYKLFM